MPVRSNTTYNGIFNRLRGELWIFGRINSLIFTDISFSFDFPYYGSRFQSGNNVMYRLSIKEGKSLKNNIIEIWKYLSKESIVCLRKRGTRKWDEKRVDTDSFKLHFFWATLFFCFILLFVYIHKTNPGVGNGKKFFWKVSICKILENFHFLKKVPAFL